MELGLKESSVSHIHTLDITMMQILQHVLRFNEM